MAVIYARVDLFGPLARPVNGQGGESAFPRVGKAGDNRSAGVLDQQGIERLLEAFQFYL